MREPAFYVVPPLEPRLLMPDNLTGHCQICRIAVQYRPGGPERAESFHGSPITMICMQCAVHDIDKLEERQRSLSRPTH